MPHSISFEPDEWMSTPLLRRPSHQPSSLVKFLIAIPVAALPAGYFLFGDSDRPVVVVATPQVRSSIPPVDFSPLPEAQAPAATAIGSNFENRAEPEAQTTLLQRMAHLDIKSMESAVDAILAQTLQENTKPIKYKRKYKRGLRPREVRKRSGNIRE